MQNALFLYNLFQIIDSPNGIITYSIEQIEPVRSRFIKHLEIDSKTGVINLKNKFDFESENIFKVSRKI